MLVYLLSLYTVRTGPYCASKKTQFSATLVPAHEQFDLGQSSIPILRAPVRQMAIFNNNTVRGRMGLCSKCMRSLFEILAPSMELLKSFFHSIHSLLRTRTMFLFNIFDSPHCSPNDFSLNVRLKSIEYELFRKLFLFSISTIELVSKSL